MNKLRGVRQILLLGLLTCTTEMAAAAVPTAPVARVQGLHAAPISAQQWCVLDMARDLAAGSGLEATFQAIVLQESSAGVQLVNRKDPSYGAAMLTLGTAAKLAGHPVTAGVLVSDTWQNLELGWTQLELCRSAYGAWRRSVACYNHGAAGVEAMSDAQLAADAYVLAIARRLDQVRRIRRLTDTCPRD